MCHRSWCAEHPGAVAFLHVDCDLYGSTRDAFAHLGERLVPGTVIVFDEYFNYPNWQQHEHRAFEEQLARSGRKRRVLAHGTEQLVVVLE